MDAATVSQVRQWHGAPVVQSDGRHGRVVDLYRAGGRLVLVLDTGEHVAAGDVTVDRASARTLAEV